MPSFYSVVEYMPDPLTGERINIGVVAFGGGEVRSRFVQNWQRVRHFAGVEDIRFLQDFARQIEEATSSEAPAPELVGYEKLTEEILLKMSQTWINTVQLTAPRGALVEVSDLLEDVASRFLRERKAKRREWRDRRVATRMAVTSVKEALQMRGQDYVQHYMQTGFHVRGALDKHRFDAVMANGTVYSAAHGISFEKPDNFELEEEVKAAAFAIDDVRNRHGDMPIGIVVLEPKQASSLFDRAVKILEGVGAEILTKDTATGWALQASERIPEAA